MEPIDLEVSGYVQAQVQGSQISQDELTPDGEPINRDRFTVRRARVRLDAETTWVRAVIEIDANTTHGADLGVRRAEAAAFLAGPGDGAAPPLAMLTLGLTGLPFGFELQQPQRERVFMERTTASRALFPGEADLGAKLSGGVGPFRYGVAVMNGVPIGDFTQGDNVVPTKKKTVVANLGAESEGEGFALGGGVSFLSGSGFSEGSPATKPALLWSDSNQDGFVTLNELIGVNGQARKPSATFPQWAVDADLRVGVRTPIGWTRVSGGATLASNLDRGLVVADPIAVGYDLRELGWHAALTQEITPYGLLGFRADAYDPNADLFEAQRGQFIPRDATILTLSPVVGAQIPDLARLLFQYDVIFDGFGRDDRGEPVDLANDQWTLRAQVAF